MTDLPARIAALVRGRELNALSEEEGQLSAALRFNRHTGRTVGILMVQKPRSEGCDAIQGYLFSRPLPAQDRSALLRSGMSLDR